MKILQRYIGRQIISSILIVTLALAGVNFVMTLVNQFDKIGTAHYGILTAIYYVLLQLPLSIYQMFPIVGFLGALIGLGKLSATSELTIMRAAGVSKQAILRSVLLSMALLVVVVTMMGEGLAPMMDVKANTLKQVALEKQVGVVASRDYWLRNNNRIVYIELVKSVDHVLGVSYFNFDQSRQLVSVGYARSAQLVKGQWVLSDVTETDLTSDHVQSRVLKHLPLDMTFNPKIANDTKKLDHSEDLLSLMKNIRYLRNAGLASSQFEFAFWQRIIQPISTLALIGLAIPFVFGSLRDSSMGSKIMMGIIVGFIFYMVNQFIGPISMLYQMPPILAAMVPTLLIVFLYYMLIFYVK